MVHSKGHANVVQRSMIFKTNVLEFAHTRRILVVPLGCPHERASFGHRSQVRLQAQIHPSMQALNAYKAEMKEVREKACQMLDQYDLAPDIVRAGMRCALRSSSSEHLAVRKAILDVRKIHRESVEAGTCGMAGGRCKNDGTPCHVKVSTGRCSRHATGVSIVQRDP